MRYYIAGRVLPAVPENFDKTDEYHRLDDFTRDEARQLNLVGLKFRINHAQHLIHGDIIHQTDAPDGSKYVIGVIDTKTKIGKLMMHMIEDEILKMRDLSLGHLASWKRNGFELDVQKTPIEVSITTKARRKESDRCCILYTMSNKALKKKLGTYNTNSHTPHHRHPGGEREKNTQLPWTPRPSNRKLTLLL